MQANKKESHSKMLKKENHTANTGTSENSMQTALFSGVPFILGFFSLLVIIDVTVSVHQFTTL